VGGRRGEEERMGMRLMCGGNKKIKTDWSTMEKKENG